MIKILNKIISIFEKIKKFFSKKIIDDINKNYIDYFENVDCDALFEEIETGYIIDAIIPIKTSKKTHMHRPCIVVKKTREHLIVCCGSSQYKNIAKNFNIELNKEYYNVWKNGYINFNRTYKIPKRYILSILDQLSSKDIMHANDILSSCKLPILNYSINIHEGLILKNLDNNKLFYVHSTSNNYVNLLKVSTKKTKHCIGLRNTIYYINPNEHKTQKLNHKLIPVCNTRTSIKKELDKASYVFYNTYIKYAKTFFL